MAGAGTRRGAERVLSKGALMPGVSATPGGGSALERREPRLADGPEDILGHIRALDDGVRRAE